MSKRKWRWRPGDVATGIGILLLASALVLYSYNMIRQNQADMASEEVLEQLIPVVSEPVEIGGDPEEIVYPDFVLDPNMEMPTVEINGRMYIGVLSLPQLELSLPVISEWTYSGFNVAPCRYSGSAYLNDFVIAAHNFSRHFGRISQLTEGDEISFTDVDGNVFTYVVSAMEVLPPTAVDEMVDSGYALTLFTCTIGGRTRLAVRCELSGIDTEHPAAETEAEPVPVP